ncbi:hypothetical protein [Salinigranum sp. GCM10025319]|uniref:hypothetical protein n=1 Tax=Salinigranum sp. GCM10025319 TaxID=3252687 RepID=UPI00361C9959
MNSRALVLLPVLCVLVASMSTGLVGAVSDPLRIDDVREVSHGPTTTEERQLSTPDAGTGSPEPTVSFTTTDSTVSLAVTPATDGFSYDYGLSDPDVATNLSVELTGVATTEVDTVSRNLTPGALWDLRIAGDARPRGPRGVGNPEVTLTAHAYSWDTGYAGEQANGTLFGNGVDSAHTIRSVPVNTELHQLTIRGLSVQRSGCAEVYVNGDGQNGAYGEGRRVASNFCPSKEPGPKTIEFERPYTTTSPGVTVEFVSKLGGPVTVPLDEVPPGRDGYRNTEPGDGSHVADITISTGIPSDVSIRDSAGDVLSFGSLSDGETVTKGMNLRTGDSLKPSYEANGADLVGTVRYQEISYSRNPAVTVNGNRIEHAGTLTPGETVVLSANTDWLRAGTNTVSVDLATGPGTDAPASVVDLRYRHGVRSSSTPTDSDSDSDSDAGSDADGGGEINVGGTAERITVTDVSFERGTIRPSEDAVVVVTLRNPNDQPGTHTVELELFGQVVDSREVAVPANGETQIQFVHDIVAPGTYTARVDGETATVTVVDPSQSPSTPTSTSTQLPGFGPLVALVAVAAAIAGSVVAVRRRDGRP